ncbi:synthase (plasmid) [Rhodococcus jostii RHA1]|uniref:Synthase n=1 Tax=Rhodococcus jostii (strain RHA1) TaxID=101510 RepID=Q0RW48_RHOJR|nr:AMP-binding protein [Rhodococcus jostii]ABH00488.1 synthase [Rhodococcus jostii RHA1]
MKSISTDPILHVGTLLEDLAAARPADVALVHGDTRRTWADFNERAGRFAAALLSHGVEPGGTVALNLYNAPEYLECFFGTLKSHTRMANVNYRYRHTELRQILERAQTQAVVFHASLADRVVPVLDELPGLRLAVQVDDLGGADLPTAVADLEALLASADPVRHTGSEPGDCYLSFTGGTTGQPKGVIYDIPRMTRNALVTRATITGEEIDGSESPIVTFSRLRELGRTPVCVPASPLMHSTGFTFSAIPVLLAGGTVVTLTGRSFDPHELLATIEREQVTTVSIVGDAFGRPLVQALETGSPSGRPYDVSSLRVVVSAGVAWSATTKAGLLAHAPQLVLTDACGATEGNTYGVSRQRLGDELTSAQFRAWPGVRIIDDERRPLPFGETGLIAGPVATTGYFEDPAATAKAFFTVGDEIHACPGDHGKLAADGTLTLLGRDSSTINTGGEKVHAEEIELVLLRNPAVLDCLVVGVPHERFGQQVAAVVAAAPGHTLTREGVRECVSNALAGYKVPRLVRLAPVPRMPNGKPDHPAARALLTEPAAGPQQVTPNRIDATHRQEASCD